VYIYILGGSTNRIKETLFPVCLGNKIYLSFSVFGDDKRVGSLALPPTGAALRGGVMGITLGMGWMTIPHNMV
jgi:hypothetical protein